MKTPSTCGHLAQQRDSPGQEHRQAWTGSTLRHDLRPPGGGEAQSQQEQADRVRRWVGTQDYLGQAGGAGH